MSIQARNIKKSFGLPAQEILKGITLEVKNGEFIAITGRSGSGKSTLLYLISSLDPATSGSIVIDGSEVQKMSVKELEEFRNEQMGFIFQFHYLLPELTSLDNVLMPARKTGTENEKKDRAVYLLKKFGLEGKMKSLPSQLSGGEQQRVAIARALLMEPRYLFADEPTGNLDSVNGKTVIQILKDISHSGRTTVIMVTHDQSYANEADRKITLADGQVIMDEIRRPV